MLSKSQIADSISSETGIGRNLIMRVLTDLSDLAKEELEKGEDFTVPGLARLSWRYRAAQKKGERWTKGMERQKFGGEREVAESDSPPVKAQIKLVAAPAGPISSKVKPSTKPEAQAVFLKTPTAKAIIKRKSA